MKPTMLFELTVVSTIANQWTRTLAVTGTDGEQHFPFLQIRCDEDGGQP